MASKDPQPANCRSENHEFASLSRGDLEARSVGSSVMKQGIRRKTHSSMKGKEPASVTRRVSDVARRHSQHRGGAGKVVPESVSMGTKSNNSRYNFRQRKHAVCSLPGEVQGHHSTIDLDSPSVAQEHVQTPSLPAQPIILAPLVIVSPQNPPLSLPSMLSGPPTDPPRPPEYGMPLGYSSVDLHGNTPSTSSTSSMQHPSYHQLPSSGRDGVETSIPPLDGRPQVSQVSRRRQGVSLSATEHQSMIQQLQRMYWPSSPPSLSQEQQQASPFPSPAMFQSGRPRHTYPRIPHQNSPPHFLNPTVYHPPPPVSSSHGPAHNPSPATEVIVISDSSDSEGDSAGHDVMDLSTSARTRSYHRTSELGDVYELGERGGDTTDSTPFTLLDTNHNGHSHLTGGTHTSNDHLADSNRSNETDEDLAQRLQFEEYDTPTSRARFPHYEPQQHPWAPTEYYVSPVRRAARMHTTPMRRRGVTSIPLPSNNEESSSVRGPAHQPARGRRRDSAALMRLAAMRGRGHHRHTHIHQGMMLMAMTVELGYEHLLELAELLGPGRPNGLTEQEINGIPVKTFEGPTNNSSWPDEDRKKCVVCLSEYVKGEKLRNLKCGHDFHQACIDCWFQRNSTCPICRFNFHQESD